MTTKFQMKYHSIFIIVLLSMGMSCNKFIDINSDPNNPTTPVLAQLLPSTQISMVGNMGQLNNGTSTLTRYVVSSSSISQYQQTGTSYGDSWDGFYSQTLNDIQTVIVNGTLQSQWGYTAIAKLEKAYLYSIMVDMWGDIPYTQAQSGAANTSPAFDKGSAIYDSLFVLIDDALADASKISATTLVPATSDVFYGGNKSSWIRLANSLKLKMLNQVRLVNPADVAAKIKALLSAGISFIDNNSLDFTFKFGPGQNPNNRHPWHRSEYQSSKSFYMGQAMIDMLFSADDPRIKYYFYRQNATATLNNGTNGNGYYGRQPGDPTAAPSDLPRRTTFGIYPAGGLYDNNLINNLTSANIYLTNTGTTNSFKAVAVTDGTGAGIMPLITTSMVDFIRAEAALTLETGDDALAFFRDGITSNLQKISDYSSANGGLALSSSVIASFVNDLANKFSTADAAGKLNMVMTQKYISLYGNGMEAYNDYRRTGLPVLREAMSPLNTFPLRLYYSETELTTNTSIIANASAMQAAQQTTPVFWDK